MKRALCIHDLPTVGRASLAVILPVLSAAGVQCCALPTAVLSSHFGGFAPVQVQQMSDQMARSFAAYEKQKIRFDAISTGYLTGPEQAALVCSALERHTAELIVVDPVMADHGKFYHGFDAGMVAALSALCQKADVITPNPTETALLLGQDSLTACWNEQLLESRCRQLAETFGCDVVLTGCRLAEDHVVCGGFDRKANNFFMLECDYVNAQYPGTGDLFTAVLTGALLRGKTLKAAANAALCFTQRVVHTTFAAGCEPRFGVEFEPLLGTLEDLLCH